MDKQRITPESFYSETPPERYMGTECEYNLQNFDKEGNQVNLNKYMGRKALAAIGLTYLDSMLSNGAKLYIDMAHLEYATQECLGPRQAAAADLAGILVMRNMITASEQSHRGLYRLTGSYLPYPQDPKIGTAVPLGKNSGSHENFLVPRKVSCNPLIKHILPSHLGSRLYAMTGTLRNSFVFSQKVWGIGGKPISHEVGRLTDQGNKPMALIVPTKWDTDTVGDPEYARLEIRFADAGYFKLGRYLAMATTSLLLRLIEHENIIGTDNLAALALKKPVYAAKMFAADLSLKQAAEMRDGKRMNALSIQESLALLSIRLSEQIQLPPSEVSAPLIWLDMIDALRASNPEKGEYGNLVDKIDVAAKHSYISNRHEQKSLNVRNAAAMQQILVWDRALPTGGAQTWANQKPSDFISDEEIQRLTTQPPEGTRAVERVKYVKNPKNITALNWAYVCKNSELYKCFDLY